MLLLRNHIHCGHFDNYTGYNTIVLPTYIIQTSGNIISRTWQKSGWDVHLEMTIWSTKLTVSQSDGDVRSCTFEYYIQTGCIMCIGETEMMANVAYTLHHCLRTLLVTYSSLKSGNHHEVLNLNTPSIIIIKSLYHEHRAIGGHLG